MKRRGAIKNRMITVAFDGPPPPFGGEILAGELRAGEIRSAIGGEAMALVRLDRIDQDLSAAGRPVRAIRPAYFDRDA